jgi:hypothetical protein
VIARRAIVEAMRTWWTVLLLAACGDSAATTDDAPVETVLPADAAIDAPPGSNLGTVGTVPGACASGALPGTSCQIVEVSCPGIAPARAEIRLTSAVGTVRGTVVFGTGGGGGGYYENDANAAAMMGQLAQMGYRVVQRRWQTMPDGWITGPGGMRALACRYATLVTYLHSTVHFGSVQTGFCVTGNSGGSTEIAYSLTHFDRGAIIDLAVPTGGPPMGRIDRGCLDGTDPAWMAECRALVPSGSSTCTNGPSCSYAAGARQLIDAAWTPATHCAQSDASFRTSLLDQSVMGASPRLAYPNTWVHFIYGADDCSEAVTLGLTYASAVTSAKQITFVPGTPHATFSTVAGARAIRDAIVNDCLPR